MLRMTRGSLPTAVLCLVVGVFMLVESRTFPGVQGQGFGEGPSFYPSVLAWALVGLGFLTLLAGLRGGRAQSALDARQETWREGAPKPRYGLVIGVCLLTLATTLALNYLGFLASAFVLVAVMLLLIRPTANPKVLALDIVISLAIVFAIYIVFEVLIGVQLPSSHFLR